MHKSDPRRIVCTACKHENEVERVYCHNCGEKLDRSLLPKVTDAQAAEDQARTGKKVQRMMNPSRMNWLRSVRKFVLIILFAAVVAALYLALQAPDKTPPVKSDRLPDREAGDLWAGMMNTKPAVSVTLTENDVNYYLGRTVKSKDEPLGTKFERAFVQFEPGTIKVTAHRSAWGLPLYSSIKFRPVLTDGKWTSEVAGVYFGRLPVDPRLGKLAPVTLGTLSKAFEREIKETPRLAAIAPGQGVITLVTKPAQ